MKIFGTALIAASLMTVAIQTKPTIDPRATTAPLLLANSVIGECCNDDFRQALPLWDAPAETEIAKP